MAVSSVSPRCQAHWGLVLEALKEKRRNGDDDGSDEDALKIVLGHGKAWHECNGMVQPCNDVTQSIVSQRGVLQVASRGSRGSMWQYDDHHERQAAMTQIPKPLLCLTARETSGAHGHATLAQEVFAQPFPDRNALMRNAFAATGG